MMAVAVLLTFGGNGYWAWVGFHTLWAAGPPWVAYTIISGFVLVLAYGSFYIQSVIVNLKGAGK
jgi:hypothetical protein